VLTIDTASASFSVLLDFAFGNAGENRVGGFSFEYTEEGQSSPG
jgi:hypothetical protein